MHVWATYMHAWATCDLLRTPPPPYPGEPARTSEGAYMHVWATYMHACATRNLLRTPPSPYPGEPAPTTEGACMHVLATCMHVWATCTSRRGTCTTSPWHPCHLIAPPAPCLCGNRTIQTAICTHWTSRLFHFHVAPVRLAGAIRTGWRPGVSCSTLQKDCPRVSPAHVRSCSLLPDPPRLAAFMGQGQH